MFKKIFNHKKSSRCEICKKKIKKNNKNVIEKQCKECKEKNSFQNISPISIQLDDINNYSIKENKKEVLCNGCKWPIISEENLFEDLNNNAKWHNSCFEINKILGLTIFIEPYNLIENNNKNQLKKNWPICTDRLSKILIAYLCDCDYYAFEIVSCIKNKDFNSSLLKDLIINMAYLLNFLILESSKLNDIFEKNNDPEKNKQNELLDLFINIIIFNKSIKKDIIYTLNVKKLVRYLSHINEILKKELCNTLNLLTRFCINIEFKNIYEYINKFEDFGYKKINNITPVFKVDNTHNNFNIDWIDENNNEKTLNSNAFLIQNYILEKIHDEEESLKINSEIIKLIYLLKNKIPTSNFINKENKEIKDKNNCTNTEVNNKSKNSSFESTSISYKTLCENDNEIIKDKGKENILNNENNENSKISNSICNIKCNKDYDKNYDLIKSSVDNILLKNTNSFLDNESDVNSHTVRNATKNEEHYLKTIRKNDENYSINSTIKEKNINSKNNELLPKSDSRKNKNKLNADLSNNKENNNINRFQYIRNLEDEKYNILKTEKSSSLFHNKYDQENDNDNSEYARSFYSLTNLKSYYTRPSSSCSTANNSEFFDRSSSPTYSVGRLDYTNKNKKSNEFFIDNQSYSINPYKDNYPITSSLSSYSPKINALNSTYHINGNNESSDINNFNGNLSSLSVTSSNSVDVIKALSSSLKKGYFSSEAYLKYCKSNQNQDKNQNHTKDLNINSNAYIKNNKKNRSYSNSSTINSKWNYENENVENITKPIKLLNLQFQHEMKKAGDIVDESFERGSVYSQSLDNNIESIKNSILKMRSIYNKNNNSSGNSVLNSKININDKNINKVSNKNLFNIDNKSNNKTINLSQDLIYINKKLNEYNNQREKYFNDKASIFSEPNYKYKDISSRSIISSNSLNDIDNKSQMIENKKYFNLLDQNMNLVNLNQTIPQNNKNEKNINIEKASSKNINNYDNINNDDINKTKKTMPNNKNEVNISEIQNSLPNNTNTSSNKNLINGNSNNIFITNNLCSEDINNNIKTNSSINIKSDLSSNKIKVNIVNNSLDDNKKYNNNNSNNNNNKPIKTIKKSINKKDNGSINESNNNKININIDEKSSEMNTNSNNNSNINILNNKVEQERKESNNKPTIVNDENKEKSNMLISNSKKSDILNDDLNEITPKGILSLPTNNKKSSLILPSKEELKIKIKDNECKPFIRNHSLFKNHQELPAQHYKELIKHSKNRSVHNSERSTSYKKKSKEAGRKYYDGQKIDSLIYDSVIKYGRDEKVANQWISQLNRQEIFTVGDLRSLYENDWYHLGLSVLAIRAIKDTLYYIN
ncbi:hypothetical protein BCR36DRAFT_410399 [Piromyces finnis]|uniref:Uncharacterized protein n=1 Tax=Piromyces finnis TaxID=1754191 RepID=A0A1Y1VGD9_9FUNG|nr:hypothetical protein BCR36DRAFT_410399 [Piromyces finnis]|eukprot:ORX55478.1 hypothetical protein BCR36DRAFT_410399 [Piromyces finnis]